MHSMMEDWLLIIAIISSISSGINYLVIMPIKSLIRGQTEQLQRLDNNLDEFKTDIYRLRERVSIVEQDLEHIKKSIERLQNND